MAHVDLVDKQNVAHARLTFSEEVEQEMRKNKDAREANFCRLVRNWYDADDTRGIDCRRRTEFRLQMQEWLLARYQPSHFPPPSSYVGGIPVVTYEALLTNVERKLQLYNFVTCYNPRSVSTLDVENFFSALGDLAPGGRSLTIRPSDLPSVLQTACDLAVLHSSPNRPFYLQTTSSSVYPKMEVIEEGPSTHASTGLARPAHCSDMSTLTLTNHIFDFRKEAETEIFPAVRTY
ncbi:uncharacterized protein [Littorina saxatilis]|uniref:uncharacterized protein n=1 Tax=Littorina saxatilis TaxID=31220 RepID=UPI0038B68EF8